MPIVPPMIYGVTLWRLGVRLPVYYADAPPDERALAAEPRITAWVCQRTWHGRTWEDWLDLANGYEEAHCYAEADAAGRIAEALRLVEPLRPQDG